MEHATHVGDRVSMTGAWLGLQERAAVADFEVKQVWRGRDPAGDQVGDVSMRSSPDKASETSALVHAALACDTAATALPPSDGGIVAHG